MICSFTLLEIENEGLLKNYTGRPVKKNSFNENHIHMFLGNRLAAFVRNTAAAECNVPASKFALVFALGASLVCGQAISTSGEARLVIGRTAIGNSVTRHYVVSVV